ncbi:sensor histidine kinase [Mucilaginibacter sp.]|uniref:sensor histidine kinase n=1 Tax=Mucilaginibacter sp. TaxID=1882438 RepID=UPI000CBFF766|nr:sensor histidine kinase [Mucilaginibacter sp.]PLW91555.1 MAG: hypothetical protein C0154_00615 [Mucilaginibacter sp.]HEK21860.1 histidine kinase [Bacteroidota bacterium]
MQKEIYKWYKEYRLHLLVWLLYILYETVVIGLVFHVYGHPMTYLGHYVIEISLFYIHANVILPWALKGGFKLFWRLPIVLIIEVWLYIFLNYAIDSILIRNGIIKYNAPFVLTITYQLKTLYRELLFIGFSTGYYYLKRYNREKEKTNDLEKQQLKEIINRQKFEQQLAKTENDFLKAQINPHFLFNTLDFIYHKILLESPAAANTIIALSEMMRFAIDADKIDGYVLLGDEIEQVNNLIHLNQLKKKESLNFATQIEDEARGLFLIPLVVLTLTENMIKHGDLSASSKPSLLSISIKHDQLIINTLNPIGLSYAVEKPVGNGIKNITNRLHYAYGQTVVFIHRVLENEYFETFISIPVELLRERRSFSNN